VAAMAAEAAAFQGVITGSVGVECESSVPLKTVPERPADGAPERRRSDLPHRTIGATRRRLGTSGDTQRCDHGARRCSDCRHGCVELAAREDHVLVRPARHHDRRVSRPVHEQETVRGLRGQRSADAYF